MSMEPQTDSEPQSAEGKAELYQHTPKQFDIDPKTHEALLMAQGVRNGLIIIPALIILVVLASRFIIGLIYGIDSISQTIINIAIVISLPYMVHVFIFIGCRELYYTGGGYGSPLRGYFGYLNDCCHDK